MVTARLHPRPAGLPEAVKWCGWCGAAWQKSFEHKCPESKGARPSSKPTPPDHPGLAKVREKRDGSHAEEALYAALDAAGYLDFRYAVNGSHRVTALYQRGYPWGLYLKPRRRFQADAAFPSADLLIEVEGVAHKIGHQQKHDVLRRQLAEAAGWRVLSVLPEQVKSGEAVELIARALNQSARAEGGS